jgi:hypothetical protein
LCCNQESFSHAQEEKYFFYPKSYFFCDLKPHAKFWNHTITPSGRKICGGEKKKEKEEK